LFRVPGSLVSIVLPTYNRGTFLTEAVESVRAQSWPDWELLLVDDGSTDDSLASVPPDARIRLISRPHTGNLAAVRNAGLDAARGAFIGFLDSDDRWRPDKLARQLARLQERSDCGWCYGAHALIDAAGRSSRSPTAASWSAREGDLFSAVVLGQAGVAMQTVLARHAIALAVRFDERLPWGDDYDFRVRLAHQAPACVVDDVVAEVREHPERGSRGPRHYQMHAAQVRALRRCRPWLTDKDLQRAVRRRTILEARHFLANARAAHAFWPGVVQLASAWWARD
jgi:glycosyltransferase involved in cell wall biosynthesis